MRCVMNEVGPGADDMGVQTYMQDFHSWFQAFVDDWNIKLAISAVMAFFSEIFGEDWWLIQCLLILLVADCALGIFSAWHFDHELNARRLHDGMVKFLAYAIAIILVWVVQEICFRVIPVAIPVMGVFAGYQSLTEIKSVVKHLERLGIKMPSLFHKLTESSADKVEDQLNELTKDIQKNANSQRGRR